METIGGATVVFGDGAGESLTAVGTDVTGGGYVGMVGSIPSGTPAPPVHSHPHTDEGFYVAEGDAMFNLDGREVAAPAGSFVFVPRGMPHTAWNAGDGPLRGIIIVSPGDAEHVFEPA